MSLTHATTVWCDGANCMDWIGDDGESPNYHRKANGWKRHEGKDYCSICYKELMRGIDQ